MRIVVLAYLATYGNAPALAKALRSVYGWKVTLIVEMFDRYGFYKGYPCLVFGKRVHRKAISKALTEAERVVVCGTPGARKLLHHVVRSQRQVGKSALAFLRSKKGVFIITDSYFFEQPNACNTWVRVSRYKPFIMPDLLSFYRGERVPLPYYPVTLVPPRVPKPEGVARIGHSPGRNREAADRKGTSFVRRVARVLQRELGRKVKFEILSGLSNDECRSRKDSFHIFVDQIVSEKAGDSFPRYRGGLGKSGLEAMARSCVVVCSGRPFRTKPFFPPPPVIQTGRAGLPGILKKLVADPDYVRARGAASREWVRKYCSPEFVAKHVGESLL